MRQCMHAWMQEWSHQRLLPMWLGCDWLHRKPWMHWLVIQAAMSWESGATLICMYTAYVGAPVQRLLL